MPKGLRGWTALAGWSRLWLGPAVLPTGHSLGHVEQQAAVAILPAAQRLYLSECAVAPRAHRECGAIDGRRTGLEDGSMDTATYATPRRSMRVFHRFRLQAAGTTSKGRKFREASQTIVVSAHGALIYLQHEVERGSILVITNPETLEDQECRVVYLGDAVEHGQRVGVEFLTPAPHFWGIDFETAGVTDWSSKQTVH